MSIRRQFFLAEIWTRDIMKDPCWFAHQTIFWLAWYCMASHSFRSNCPDRIAPILFWLRETYATYASKSAGDVDATWIWTKKHCQSPDWSTDPWSQSQWHAADSLASSRVQPLTRPAATFAPPPEDCGCFNELLSICCTVWGVGSSPNASGMPAAHQCG